MPSVTVIEALSTESRVVLDAANCGVQTPVYRGIARADVSPLRRRTVVSATSSESGCLITHAAHSGWYTPYKANYRYESVSEQVQ
jgi:hypothetical protein